MFKYKWIDETTEALVDDLISLWKQIIVKGGVALMTSNTCEIVRMRTEFFGIFCILSVWLAVRIYDISKAEELTAKAWVLLNVNLFLLILKQY